jgi:hypothetical protein
VGLPVFTVFAAFGIIVWLAYQDNARVPDGEPPLVRAIASPYKLAPDDPGGRQVPDQGEINALLRDEPGPALPERVLPLPEEPRAPIVRVAPPSPPEPAEADEQPTELAAPSESNDQAPPAQAARVPESMDATQEAEAALARLLAGVEPQAPSAEEPAAAPQAAPPAPGPVLAVPAKRPDPPPSVTAPTTIRRDAPGVGTPSREAEQALDRLLAEVAGVPVDATPESQAAPASQPPRAVAAISPSDPGPGFRVQLAAVREQDDVRRAWSGLVERLGSLVSDHQPHYERAETANGVFYRIQLGPFANEQTAERLCVEVQQRNASCFVVAR